MQLLEQLLHLTLSPRWKCSPMMGIQKQAVDSDRVSGSVLSFLLFIFYSLRESFSFVAVVFIFVVVVVVVCFVFKIYVFGIASSDFSVRRAFNLLAGSSADMTASSVSNNKLVSLHKTQLLPSIKNKNPLLLLLLLFSIYLLPRCFSHWFSVFHWRKNLIKSS